MLEKQRTYLVSNRGFLGLETGIGPVFPRKVTKSLKSQF
nr:B339 [uncultured bacterium]